MNKAGLKRISAAIDRTDVDPQAKEAAEPLVAAFVETYECESKDERTLGVEVPFVIRPSRWTWIVGVIDRVSQERKSGDIVVSDWKTTKAEDPPRYTEARWFVNVTSGVQLPTYVLATKRGSFPSRLETSQGIFYPSVGFKRAKTNVKVRVRGVTKSDPPKFWPRVSRGFLTYTETELAKVQVGYEAAAVAIRALRAAKIEPWALPGNWCRNQYGRDCDFLADCTEDTAPAPTVLGWHEVREGDPGYVHGLQAIPSADLKDPRAVVLSTSSYNDWGTCAELFRKKKLTAKADWDICSDELTGRGDLNQQIGTAYHAGVAEFWRIVG